MSALAARCVSIDLGYPDVMASTHRDRYFFAHHKCASNWMRKMLRDFCRGRQWGYRVSGGINHTPFEPAPGMPTFVIRTNALWLHANALQPEELAFNLIRDPRDALVSGYWSWRNSHKNNDRSILRARDALRSRNTEEGLVYMLDHLTLLSDLEGWPIDEVPNILDVRYEDMLQDTQAEMTRIFEHLEIEPRHGEIQRIVSNNSFEMITGRKPGEEDVSHHFRKGIAGDWKNAFTPRVAEAFRDRFQHDLVRLGYETDDAWVSQTDANRPTTA